MSNLSLVPSSPVVNEQSKVASKDIERGRCFASGYVLLENSFIYHLILNCKSFSSTELRVLLALSVAKYKGALSAQRLWDYLDRHYIYPARISRAREKFLRVLEESRKETALKSFPIKLPRLVLKSLAQDGSKLEILLFLFSATKQTKANRMTFTLPQDFLARKFGAHRNGIQFAIRRMINEGLLVRILTPAKLLDIEGQRYSWFCNNYLPELKRYYVRKQMKAISSSCEPRPLLSPDRQYPSPVRSSVPDYSSAPLSLPR